MARGVLVLRYTLPGGEGDYPIRCGETSPNTCRLRIV